MDHLRLHAPVPPLPAADLRALQALAEPNRARIVELLNHGEHCVCDVGGVLGLSAGLVSHHLRVLRQAGLVAERRNGRWVHYSLDLARVGRLRASLGELLTPTDGATAACICSDCGPTATGRKASVATPVDSLAPGTTAGSVPATLHEVPS